MEDMERRELLTWIGIGGGVGIGTLGGLWLLGGGGEDDDDGPRTETTPSTGRTETATGTPEPQEVRHAEEFSTVVDAVAAGVDPNGTEPINPFLEEHAGDDTLLSFREGTYPVRPIDLSGYRHLGIAAATEASPTFLAQGDDCIGGGNAFIRLDGVDDLLLDDVTFDFSPNAIGGAIRINATGDATIRDIEATGGCHEQVVLFRIDVTDADSTAVVENLAIDNRDEDIALTGIYVGQPHAGEVVFRDCNVQGFTDNGLYGSPPGLEDGQGGIVHVEGGTYRNNNISNVRLGSEGSTARGVESISDTPPPTTEDSAPANARGFRLRSGQGQLIENCEVRITADSRFTHGGIVFHQTNGGAVVRDTAVEIDRDRTPAIRTFPIDSDHSGTPLFEGLEIVGNAAEGETVMLDGRDGTVFRNCLLEQRGADRNGIYFRDCGDCRIVDSRIDVTRNALILRGSNVTIENSTLVTPDGSQEIDEMDASDEDFTPRGEK